MRTRKTAFAAMFLCFVLVPAAFAQEGIERLLSERGLTLVSRDAAPGRFAYTLAASDGTRFGVESNSEIGEESVKTALRLLDTLMSWKSLTPGTQNFRVDGDTVTLRLVPGKFVSAGKDLKPYVPSGLSFSISGDRIEYDFRLKSGGYFLRFNGKLQTESSFLERVKRAVDSPSAFARDNDPDYLGRRLAELQEALEASEAKNAAAETRAASLETRLAALEARIAADEKADDTLRRAAMAAHSKGIFSPQPVPEAAIERVRSLKTAQPGISAADILSALRKEGIPASDRQVRAILAVFFGE